MQIRSLVSAELPNSWLLLPDHNWCQQSKNEFQSWQHPRKSSVLKCDGGSVYIKQEYNEINTWHFSPPSQIALVSYPTPDIVDPYILSFFPYCTPLAAVSRINLLSINTIQLSASTSNEKLRNSMATNPPPAIPFISSNPTSMRFAVCSKWASHMCLGWCPARQNWHKPGKSSPGKQWTSISSFKTECGWGLCPVSTMLKVDMILAKSAPDIWLHAQPHFKASNVENNFSSYLTPTMYSEKQP